MNKNKKLSDMTVKEFEELLKNTIPKLYCPQTQPYWYFPQTQQYQYFPNEAGGYPPINMNDNVKVTYSTHTEALNENS
ncbi:MAG: hypothetical protein E7373_06540 [Clostridiales bacterium]|nr:hypothetical protein [Clostridiales bacterium]